MKYGRVPTAVHDVFTTLVAKDDFMSVEDLTTASRRTRHEVLRSLWVLRQYRAVECVRQGDGLWWFATPNMDTRIRHNDERTPESRPRKIVPGRRRRRESPA